jgi:CRISPR/Cas system-associated exonuclease Cas4 (RecB family)
MRPWSKSKLDVATGCPLRFHLQYVEKAKGARVERGEGRIGRAAHRALEVLLKGKDVSLNELLAQYATDEELTSVEEEELLCLRDQITAFIARFQKWMQRHNVSRPDLYIERRLAIRENFKKTRFWDNEGGMFRGVVDLMVRVPAHNGVNIVILDHKTGRSKDLKYHDDQMKAYAVMADANVAHVKSVRLAMHFLRHEEIKWFPPVTVDVIRSEYRPWLLAKIKSVEAEVAARTTTDANPGWGCDYCSYQHQCPAK